MQVAVGCVTAARPMVSREGFEPTPISGLPHGIGLGARPVPLRGPARISVSVYHYYRVVRSAPGRMWRVNTAAYLYALDDEHGREIIAYHWHPSLAGQERIAYPHL